MENTTNIIIQGKDTLAEANRDFLAKYDTLDKHLDYYTDLAIKLYDEFEIDGTMTKEGVRKNIATWFENKQSQMERFRKHKYWCEEAKAIVFSQTEVREIDYNAAYCAFENLENWVYDELYGNGLDTSKWYFYAIKYALNRCADQDFTHNGLITEDFIQYMNMEWNTETLPDAVKRSLRVGAKITKFVYKCYQNVPMKDGTMFDATALTDDGDDARTRKSFDKYYAKFADYLSELKIKKITLISLNFLDFMTMSNGNSWSSCHFINSHGIFHEDSDSSYEGQYKAGCLSYALDKPSFLLYTLPATFDGTDYYRCQKLTRMCCQYEDGILITGKCYPNNSDSLITRYRQMMQMILAEAEALPNLWVFSKKISKVTAFTETEYNTAHYADYHMEHQKPTISFCKGISIDLDAAVKIGHEGYCLHCGETLSGQAHRYLQCEEHRTIRRCPYCNKYIKSTDSYRIVNGEYYCEEHTFYCDYHKQYETLNWKHGVETIDGVEMTICHATMRSFRSCRLCGALHHKDDLTDGVCPECRETHTKCSFCGKYVPKDEITMKGSFRCCAECIDCKLVIDDTNGYRVGDYILVKDDVSCCLYGSNPDMQCYYAGRIVRVLNIGWGSIGITSLDGRNYSWSPNCFKGIVRGGIEEFVGMTLKEASNYLKEI